MTEELYVQTIEACIASLARREALELQAEMAARFPPHVNSWSRTRVLSKLDLEGKRRGLQVCRQLGFPTSGGCGVRGEGCRVRGEVHFSRVATASMVQYRDCTSGAATGSANDHESAIGKLLAVGADSESCPLYRPPGLPYSRAANPAKQISR